MPYRLFTGWLSTLTPLPLIIIEKGSNFQKIYMVCSMQQPFSVIHANATGSNVVYCTGSSSSSVCNIRLLFRWDTKADTKKKEVKKTMQTYTYVCMHANTYLGAVQCVGKRQAAVDRYLSSIGSCRHIEK